MSTFAGVSLAGGHRRRARALVPNGWTKERIESRYLDEVREALADVGSTARRPLEIVRAARSSAASDDPRGAEPARRLARRAAHGPVQQGLALDDAHRPGPTGARLETLNPKYTFDAFVIGSSNRFAHAAALAVAERPALAYNPLFIYGDAGLGKTHLLQAVAHFVRENYPNFLIRYVTSETFLNDYVESIRNRTQDAFRRKYRDTPDVLLVDDIQFVEGKEGFQEEFFHTFNALYETSRQIVLTSDRSPGPHRHPRGPPPHPVQVGADHRHPAARPRDPPRHPAQEGRAGDRRRPPRGAGVHRRVDHRQHPRARGRAHPRGRLRHAHQGAAHRRERPR